MLCSQSQSRVLSFLIKVGRVSSSSYRHQYLSDLAKSQSKQSTHRFKLPSIRFISSSNVIDSLSHITSARSSPLGAVEEKSNLEELNHTPAVTMPFAFAKLGPFFQDRPRLHNQFRQDVLLRSFLQRHIPSEHLSEIIADLDRFGERVTGDIYDLSLQMEAEVPRLEQLDAWGKRVDRLITSTAWQKMKDVSAEEGLIACAYERKYAEWSRLYQFSKIFLFEPSSGLYGCPLAMTNGAAKTLELLKDKYPDVYQRAYHHLISRDPQEFWTSGQWMTEKQGGSDVAQGTETLAFEQADGSYRLHGYKWFSSATDADITMALARVADKQGKTIQGTRGLSLFYVEVRDEDGNMNNIQMLKLKNKLGTRQLPTAELLIDGARAFKVSEDGRGVASISHMLTLTRIHTAIAATSTMRRILSLSRDYSTRRKAFGKQINEHALHMNTLAGMEVTIRASEIFCLELARLLGRQETLPPSPELQAEEEVLRITVPLLKLYTSKQAVAVVSEGLESFGGQGYIEDTDLPRMLRDVQVSSIWEGTTNILSLDVLRAIHKSSGSVLVHFREDVLRRLNAAREKGDLAQASEKVEKSLEEVLGVASQLDQSLWQMAARDLAYSLARIFMGSLLLEHASHPVASPSDVYAAQRWCEQDLCCLATSFKNSHFTEAATESNSQLVFEGYSH